jgi:long-chain acyl-CoA synthetase
MVSPEGEILAKGPNVMRGYHNNPAATAEVIDRQGWFHTGDLGFMDPEGYVTLTGRKKELLKTSTGKDVSPLPIEQALTRHHLVEAALVIAEGRPYTTSLLFPNLEELQDYQKYKGHDALSREEFLASDLVASRMKSLLDAVNRNLNQWEKVQKYKFITVPVSVETGELTPTFKLRRDFICGKYRDQIEEMYR